MMTWKGFETRRYWSNRDISQNLPGGTEENNEKPQPASLEPGTSQVKIQHVAATPARYV